jgi:hypothetical protein
MTDKEPSNDPEKTTGRDAMQFWIDEMEQQVKVMMGKEDGSLLSE